jgi:uncharacterized protein YeaO (DUF488 family)
MGIAVKRVYKERTRTDGLRVLVDRLWPRGLSKEAAAVDVWLRDVAPSDGLRHWIHSTPDAWPAFRRRYLQELSEPKATEALDQLYRLATDRKQLTLLFASRDEERNNATVLRDLLQGMRKPPTGTGPVRAGRARQAKRMR